VGWFEAVVLGLVQGLTEFLPVSSSAHLRIVGAAFGWKDPGAAFTAIGRSAAPAGTHRAASAAAAISRFITSPSYRPPWAPKISRSFSG